MDELYDEEYFERGLETRKSCYQNYRWIPELTIPLAMTIVDYLGIGTRHKILDFGCAKGFLVKAFRLLNRNAFGMDISRYAIENCDSYVKEFCFNNEHFSNERFDFCIAKDVFEHIDLLELSGFLQSNIADVFFAVIPLGIDNVFNASFNNLDYTHVNCMTKDQWIQFFYDNNLDCNEFTTKIKGIKDSYYGNCPEAHGFFTLSALIK